MSTETKLTDAQRNLLLRAMRDDGSVNVSGQRWRVASNLEMKGLLEHQREEQFAITTDGLKALLYCRMVEDANSGSMASMANVEEVRAAIAKAEGR